MTLNTHANPAHVPGGLVSDVVPRNLTSDLDGGAKARALELHRATRAESLVSMRKGRVPRRYVAIR